jgi:hypothetical protein
MTPRMTDRGKNRILVRTARQPVTFYDWLSGPPLTERERTQPVIVSLERARRDFNPF